MSEITVNVVYALADAATEVLVALPQGATVAAAIARANFGSFGLGIDVAGCPVGIFGKRARRDTVLADGDRVELYRPLRLEAKEARRQRVRAKHAKQP